MARVTLSHASVTEANVQLYLVVEGILERADGNIPGRAFILRRGMGRRASERSPFSRKERQPDCSGADLLQSW